MSVTARQLSSTTYPLLFTLVSSVDHITGATGKSGVITALLSKSGGAEVTPSGAFTEIGHGQYAFAGNATDRNTLGQQVLYITATGCDPATITYDILTVDPFAANGGLTGAFFNTIADTILRRSTANIEASSDGDTLSPRSLYGAIARLAHKISISGSTMTITKSDDTTSLSTAALTTDATADPTTGIDPS